MIKQATITLKHKEQNFLIMNPIGTLGALNHSENSSIAAKIAKFRKVWAELQKEATQHMEKKPCNK